MENTKKVVCSCFLLLFVFSYYTHANPNKYNQVKDIVYTDNQGNYYFQYVYSGGVNEPMRYGYESRVYDVISGNVLSLKNLLNIDRFHQIKKSPYYTDDKHIFVIPDYATDIYIKALDINISHYKVIGQYLKDNQKVYFGARKVEHANAKEFNVMILKVGGIETKDYIDIELGYDNKHLYYNYSILSYDELISLELDKKKKDQLIKKYFPTNK